MKKHFLTIPTFALVLSSLSLLAAFAPSAHADESFGNGIGTNRTQVDYGHPTIDIQASGESTNGGEMRGIIRVVYTTGELDHSQRQCEGGWNTCDTQYFRVSAELGVNLANGTLPRVNVQVTP